ncbi:Hypothetical predicted protein [Mytilus galloprovincialis]|uniref:Uncharacterized protein n=1 Tax=Mytilus galloprovincialis TaxID=29158 RepID=A0A8B6F9R5_MYTGA|nr:Hypothetical predicted protein [Mytilus galloprovincialis]
MEDDIDIAVDKWYELFNQVINKHAPMKTKRVKTFKTAEWFNEEIKNSIQYRNMYHSKKDWINFKKWRNKTTSLIFNAKKEYYQNAITSSKNSKELWNHIKELNPKEDNIFPPKMHQVSDRSFLQTALTKLIDEWLKYLDNGEIVGTVFLDFSQSIDDFCQLVEKANTLKKPDHEILVKFIKGLPEQLAFFVRAGHHRDSPSALAAAKMGEAYGYRKAELQVAATSKQAKPSDKRDSEFASLQSQIDTLTKAVQNLTASKTDESTKQNRRTDRFAYSRQQATNPPQATNSRQQATNPPSGNKQSSAGNLPTSGNKQSLFQL